MPGPGYIVVKEVAKKIIKGVAKPKKKKPKTIGGLVDALNRKKRRQKKRSEDVE